MSIINVDDSGTVLGHQIEFNSLQVSRLIHEIPERMKIDKTIVGSESWIQYQRPRRLRRFEQRLVEERLYIAAIRHRVKYLNNTVPKTMLYKSNAFTDLTTYLTSSTLIVND